MGVEIKHIIQGSTWIDEDVFKLALTLTIFTKGWSTVCNKKLLDSKYEDVIFEVFPVANRPMPMF